MGDCGLLALAFRDIHFDGNGGKQKITEIRDEDGISALLSTRGEQQLYTVEKISLDGAVYPVADPVG